MGLFDWFRAVAKSQGEKADIASVALEQGESAEMAGLNFQEAVAAHQKWKARLQAVIDGRSQETLDPAVVSRDDQCVLGKWIHGQGTSSFGNRPVFADLRTAHAEFHRVAGEVLGAAYGGQQAEAEAKMGSSFAQASTRVVGLLAALFIEVKESGT